MRFTLTHLIFDTMKEFTEDTAPLWLSSEDTIRGSTMDNRWFYKKVLELPVGGTIFTDFHEIKRIE